MERDFGLMEVSAKHGSGIKEAFNRMISEVYRFQMLDAGGEDEIITAGGISMRKQSIENLRQNTSSIVLNPNMHYYPDATAEKAQQKKKKKNCC